MGRVLALTLAEKSFEVMLFEKSLQDGPNTCAYTAGGLLAPYCEWDGGDPEVTRLGLQALAWWENKISRMVTAPLFRKNGTLVVAHPQDRPELDSFAKRLQTLAPDCFQACSPQSYEAELDPRLTQGIFLSQEGFLDPRGILNGLSELLLAARVDMVRGKEVDTLSGFDFIVDTRGISAQPFFSQLRGVRGEAFLVHAPEVKLSRAVRLLHPRHPLYVVPRPDGHYYLGATVIESESREPITVRSTMELLSAAFVLHSGFAEATIKETITQLRPAFPDNRPRIRWEGNRLCINGLYRHGFLLSPSLAELAAGELL